MYLTIFLSGSFQEFQNPPWWSSLSVNFHAHLVTSLEQLQGREIPGSKTTTASEIFIKGLWCVHRITFPSRKTPHENTPHPRHCFPQCCLPALSSVPCTASLAEQETVVFNLIKSIWLLDLGTYLEKLLHTIRKLFSNTSYCSLLVFFCFYNTSLIPLVVLVCDVREGRTLVLPRWVASWSGNTD